MTEAKSMKRQLAAKEIIKTETITSLRKVIQSREIKFYSNGMIKVHVQNHHNENWFASYVIHKSKNINIINSNHRENLVKII